jgi:hypothetical protein
LIYWDLKPKEGVLGVFLPNEKLERASHNSGADLGAVREAFSAVAEKMRCFRLVTPEGKIVGKQPQQITDIVYWSWLPIFSARGRKLALEVGSEEEDFLPVYFQSNPEEVHYLHVPQNSLDVVDVKRSKFLMVIPLDPPAPCFIEHLVFRKHARRLPHCFRAVIPGHRLVFGEVFVSDDFKRAWQKRRLTGARFCP